jgi:ABC-type protease/lipase transport system fused ATPase/permease subunit
MQPLQSHTELPKPRASLRANFVTAVPPGKRRMVLRNLTFALKPGEAMGVIGPSGAGKSSLAKILTGVWPIVGGTLRLDGAALAHYGPDVLGQHIEYLPQRLQLFDGTIAQNIARLEQAPDDEKIITAAKLTAAHEMILELPQGYDTVVKSSVLRLSGGQIQRIGLARALYYGPVFVVLDEPNSNLDNAGSTALNGAIRRLKANGKSILIMAHRPTAIQECDLLLVLDGGAQVAFGPKDEVMASMVKNAQAIRSTPVQAAGVA